MLYDLARWDEILLITDELNGLDEGDGAAMGRLLGLPYRALVLSHRGDSSGAEAVIDHLLPKARAAADPQLLVPSLAAAALVADARGDGALEFVGELSERTRLSSDRYRTLSLPELTRICVEADIDLARRARPKLGMPCPLCGRVILAGQRLDLDHSSRLVDDPTAIGDRIGHARCNQGRS